MSEVKKQVTYLHVDAETGDYKLRNKGYDHEVDESGMIQLDSNIGKCASAEGIELFNIDVENHSKFIISKTGKAFTPNVAYEPVSPWPTRPEIQFFGGVAPVKTRYTISLKKGFKAIDLTAMDVEPAGRKIAKQKSLFSEDDLKKIPEADRKSVTEAMNLILKTRSLLKESKKVETKNSSTVKPEAVELDI